MSGIPQTTEISSGNQLSSSSQETSAIPTITNEKDKSPYQSIYPELPKLDLAFATVETPSVEPVTPPIAPAKEPSTSYFAADVRTIAPINQTGVAVSNPSEEKEFGNSDQPEKIHHRTVTFATNVEQREIPPEDYEDQSYFKEMPSTQLTQEEDNSGKKDLNSHEEHFAYSKSGPQTPSEKQTIQSSSTAHDGAPPTQFNAYHYLSAVGETKVQETSEKPKQDLEFNAFEAMSSTKKVESSMRENLKPKTEEKDMSYNVFTSLSREKPLENSGKAEKSPGELNAYHLLTKEDGALESFENQKEPAKTASEELNVYKVITASEKKSAEQDNRHSALKEQPVDTSEELNIYKLLSQSLFSEANSDKTSQDVAEADESYNVYNLLSKSEDMKPDSEQKKSHVPQENFNVNKLFSQNDSNEAISKELGQAKAVTEEAYNVYDLLKKSVDTTTDLSQKNASAPPEDLNVYKLLSQKDTIQPKSNKADQINQKTEEPYNAYDLLKQSDPSRGSANATDTSSTEETKDFNAYDALVKFSSPAFEPVTKDQSSATAKTEDYNAYELLQKVAAKSADEKNESEISSKNFNAYNLIAASEKTKNNSSTQPKEESETEQELETKVKQVVAEVQEAAVLRLEETPLQVETEIQKTYLESNTMSYKPKEFHSTMAPIVGGYAMVNKPKHIDKAYRQNSLEDKELRMEPTPLCRSVMPQKPKHLEQTPTAKPVVVDPQLVKENHSESFIHQRKTTSPVEVKERSISPTKKVNVTLPTSNEISVKVVSNTQFSVDFNKSSVSVEKTNEDSKSQLRKLNEESKLRLGQEDSINESEA